MSFTTEESDYLLTLLDTQLFTLLSRVTRWQTHSLSQAQYDRQVAETLTPNLTLMTQIVTKLAPTVSDQTQLGALQVGLTKLTDATTYQLTTTQLNLANERRMNRHRR
ncbi:hypothetical protein [Lactiplantibacillus fabifermentans]|uniref:Uncharacterized protein n=2 Tax=Lactiplantibacillus fabifermentans TaxID=483011 RepID=A0A0R2NR56_9LACO|nr:hypothetical protein [Lactiplantibacillus fabifermentans]ETY73471.1 hypothetical protein LFAB_12135 [Lactiplantibacillus fabifermentans T30PCM01]KRO27227.1 hypothetical protein DY78_GL000198 [Lactiplantibacillus fabifermentans DSM 21115]